MAYASTTLDSLIGSIQQNGSNRDNAVLSKGRDAALKHLRAHRHARTNQFAVEQRLARLLERMYIVNNDAAAQALAARLSELDDHNEALLLVTSRGDPETSVAHDLSLLQWKPEILTLLLELAAQAAEKASVDNLKAIRERTPSPPKLTWLDIVGEEGVLEDKAWGRSLPWVASNAQQDDDVTSWSSHDSNLSLVPDVPHVGAIGSLKGVSTLFTTPEPSRLDNLASRHQTKINPPLLLDEIQLVREIIDMLNGLPSMVFESRGRGQCIVHPGYYLDNISSTALYGLLDELAHIGTTLAGLRNLPSALTGGPVWEAYVDCVQEELLRISAHLLDYQDSMFSPKGNIVVSVLGFYGMLKETLPQYLAILMDLGLAFKATHPDAPLNLLDGLFDWACKADAACDTAQSRISFNVFHRCFTTFMRDMDKWVNHGIIPMHFQFLIRKRNMQDDHPLMEFWQNAFIVQIREDHSPFVPNFLVSSVPEILKYGKQAALSRELGLFAKTPQNSNQFDFAPFVEAHTLAADIPFSTKVEQELQHWITSVKSSSDSQELCTVTRNAGHLMVAHAAMCEIYLGSNHAVFGQFARQSLQFFLNGSMADSLVVQNLARQAFASSSCVVPSALSASLNTIQDSIVESTFSRQLASIQVRYELPHPVLYSVITREQFAVYRRVSTILMQLDAACSYLSEATLSAINAILGASGLLLRQKLLCIIFSVQTWLLSQNIEPAKRYVETEWQRATDFGSLVTSHATFVSRLETVLEKNHAALEVALELATLAVGMSNACRTFEVESEEESDGDEDPNLLRDGKASTRHHPEFDVLYALSTVAGLMSTLAAKDKEVLDPRHLTYMMLVNTTFDSANCCIDYDNESL